MRSSATTAAARDAQECARHVHMYTGKRKQHPTAGCSGPAAQHDQRLPKAGKTRPAQPFPSPLLAHTTIHPSHVTMVHAPRLDISSASSTKTAHEMVSAQSTISRYRHNKQGAGQQQSHPQGTSSTRQRQHKLPLSHWSHCHDSMLSHAVTASATHTASKQVAKPSPRQKNL